VTAGPVAAALEQELLAELRRHGTVVWLDGARTFVSFVDGLLDRSKAGAFPFPVVAYRGSFLELLLALEPFGSGLDNAPLLIHMPSYTEETIRKTPVLELYESGVRFRRAPETLLREVAAGKVAPEALERFLAQKAPTLEAADEWLASQLDSSREGLARTLDTLGARTVLDGAVETLSRRDGFLTKRVGTAAEREVLQAFFSRYTGFGPAWLTFFDRGGGEGTPEGELSDLLSAWIGWLLAVEYVHDLTRQPQLPELAALLALSPPLVKVCTSLVEHLREKHPDAYATFADEVELHLQDELPAVRAEDLGRIDTFRVEEQRVLEAAVAALAAGEWAKVKAWADVRTEDRSFWLRRDPARRRSWALVREGAELGIVLTGCPRPLEAIQGLPEAVERYASAAFAVDRAHRRFEQRQATLLDSQVPHFGDLKGCVHVLRQAYREWADRLATDFARICRAAGFLPEDSLQQRTLFEQVVLPAASDERLALFLLDAFRFEMATELLDELKAPGTVVDLKPRLAELPTVTSVGMNALAPVSQAGRLQVAGAFAGFKTGEFTVRTPEDRARAIGQRAGGSHGKQSLLLKLSDVCDADPEQLKRRIASARVVVVHGTEVDDAGEANVGPATFELSLRQLRSAWAQLQRAGVKSFVFTADHGFMLLDETTRTVPFGKRTDPKPRYVLDELARAEPGMVNVSLQALGYDGLAGHLLFREDTALFATTRAGATFVHGGNSLQERVIPVLTVRRERAPVASHVRYEVRARREKDAMGVRRLSLRVVTAAGQLGFTTRRDVTLALRAVGEPGVSVVLKDLSGQGAIQDGRLRLPADGEGAELFFSLEGAASGQARIEVYHPDGVEKLDPVTLEDWFEVDFRRGGAAEPQAAPAGRELSWTDAFASDGERRVFVHLQDHGSITEAEVTQFLGSPRAFRRFSLAFDELLRKVPFKVRIETAPDGKRYVKEGEK